MYVLALGTDFELIVFVDAWLTEAIDRKGGFKKLPIFYCGLIKLNENPVELHSLPNVSTL